MKIRNGFVTNSSSSSFIIGKVDEEKITIDEVFDFIKKKYKEWIEKSNQVFGYVTNRHESEPNYPVIENYSIIFQNNISFDKENNILKELERTFHISHYDLYDGRNIDFINCKNYEEYRNWAKETIRKVKSDGKSTYGVAPFSIAYLTDSNPEILYNGDKEHDSSWEYNEIIEWYCPMADNFIPNVNFCKNCEYRQDCGGEDVTMEINKNIDKPIIERLGQVCVYSQCGLIPDYIVSQFSEISHLYCNHMG